MKKVNTSNLIEVSYLLDLNHQITGAERKPGAYGVIELFVTLEGELIDLDHKNFLSGSTMPITKIPEAMEAIRNQIWKDLEAAL